MNEKNKGKNWNYYKFMVKQWDCIPIPFYSTNKLMTKKNMRVFSPYLVQVEFHVSNIDDYISCKLCSHIPVPKNELENSDKLLEIYCSDNWRASFENINIIMQQHNNVHHQVLWQHEIF